MQTSKDHECLLSFKFFHVQTQKVFMNFFNRRFGHQVVWCTLYEQLKFTVVYNNIVLSNTYVISCIGFQVLFLFRYYFLKYLLQFSGEYFTFFSFFVFSVAFFCGCFPQHCIDIVLFLHCSYALEIWFAHITVLSSILRHFGSLCYIPKDPSLFTVSYFPLVLSVLMCLNANNVLDMTAYF